MIAIREAWNAGLFGRQHWLPNLVSGLVVGVVALPLAMAFAIASGAEPEQGIYTAIIAGLVVSVFGGSRLQIAGPTGAFIVILASITARYGIDGLQIATMMAGVILLLLGITRMGNIIKFIPDPVIVGFTAGIGVIIFVGQWKEFFGLPDVIGRHFHDKFWFLIKSIPALHLPTTLLAISSLLLVVLTPRIPFVRRIPGPLIAMLAATLVQAIFQFNGVATIGSAFEGIPEGLPEFDFPSITAGRVIELIGPAFTIAMLGAIESLLSAVVADGMAGTRHNSNQELIGQGLANVITPLFGGFAATGAIARTATNIRNGGSSPLAGIVHSVTLVMVVVFLAPLASDIPLCSLAAILFVVAFNMSEPKHFVSLVRRAPKADVGILLITFILTVFADLVVAVNIGVLLAVLQFLRRMSSSVDVFQVPEQELKYELDKQGQINIPDKVLVYSIEGPFFFGAAEKFERALAQTHTDPSILIIRMHHVPFIDITGLLTLEEVTQKLAKRNIKTFLCDANERVKRKLIKAEILTQTSGIHYFDRFSDAVIYSGTLTAIDTQEGHD